MGVNSVNWFHALTHFGGPPVAFWNFPVAMIAAVCLLLAFAIAYCILGQLVLAHTCDDGKPRHRYTPVASCMALDNGSSKDTNEEIQLTEDVEDDSLTEDA